MTERPRRPLNKDNDALRFPFAEAPAPGTVFDVAPGVKWLRMPLPFALNHINLWVLDDGDGWTLVDTGINSADTRELWTVLFAGPLKDKPVKRILCTHFHPDHLGLAGWLVGTHGVPLWITREEIEAARYNLALTSDIAVPLASRLYTQAGLESALPAMLAARGDGYKGRVSALPETYIALDPTRPVQAAGTTWSIVVGEGHSPQLAALYAPSRRVLISGDQVLPGISPNVSVRDSLPDSNPLKDFLESLMRFRALPNDTLVLPSHKMPFYGLHERVDQLIGHHHDRLGVARAACANGATARDVMQAMFNRDFDAQQLAFALGETLAHLNYLIVNGEILREETPAGVDRYRAISSAAAA
ncbi:MAG: MBL fold metallo-hydrolase [Rhodospirillaceae bacterium]|nr:MBL fold metallo-hydrolase [Rhodospirillaceae bacterium]